MTDTIAALVADRPADYARFGLDPTTIALWEDGARTDNRPGTYEWWYFDAHLDDGAKLVVVFQNKDAVNPDQPLSPLLRLSLDLPDGRSFEKLISLPAAVLVAPRPTGPTCGSPATGSRATCTPTTSRRPPRSCRST